MSTASVIVVGLGAVAFLIVVVALFRTTPSGPVAREAPPGDSGKGLVDLAGPLGFVLLLFRRRERPKAREQSEPGHSHDPDPETERRN